MKESRRYQQHVSYLDEIIVRIASKLDLTDDTERVLKMVEAVLWAVRSRLAFPRALQFLTKLPLPLQGIFVEQWNVSEFLPVPFETFSDVIEEVVRANPSLFTPDDAGHLAAQQAVSAIVETIREHTSPEVMQTITHLFSEDIQEHLL